MSPKAEKPARRKEVRGVQSIEVGGRLLAVLADSQASMMLKAIAQQAEIAPAQAHAYLLSYRRIGLVEQDDNGFYQLGPFALDLALARMSRINPEKMANDVAEALSEKTGMTVGIVTWSTFGPTVVGVLEGRQQIHMNTRPGTVYSLTGTVSGRAFAAHLPPGVVSNTLQLQSAASIRKRLVGEQQPMTQADMQAVRTRGYVTMTTLPVPGVAAISAPVFDDVGRIRLALTLISSERQLGPGGIAAHAPDLLMAAHSLSTQLGYSDANRADGIASHSLT